MSQTKQITDFALHKFLEKIEEAILEGFRVHKTPTSYAKLIGGRYNVVMVKADEMPIQTHPVPEALTTDELPPYTNVLPSKTTTRKVTKKAGDESES